MLPTNPTEWLSWGLSFVVGVYMLKEFIAWLKEKNKSLESHNRKLAEDASKIDVRRVDGIEGALTKIMALLREIELDIARHNLTDLKKDVKSIRDDVQEIAGGLAIDRARAEAEKRALNEVVDTMRADIRCLKAKRASL